MAVKLRVKKKSGRIERFQLEKIERSVLSAGSTAGATLGLALSVAKEVVKEVIEDVTKRKEGVVSSRVIRRRVVKSLKKRHPGMAEAYVRYRKKKK